MLLKLHDTARAASELSHGDSQFWQIQGVCANSMHLLLDVLQLLLYLLGQLVFLLCLHSTKTQQLNVQINNCRSGSIPMLLVHPVSTATSPEHPHTFCLNMLIWPSSTVALLPLLLPPWCNWSAAKVITDGTRWPAANQRLLNDRTYQLLLQASILFLKLLYGCPLLLLLLHSCRHQGVSVPQNRCETRDGVATPQGQRSRSIDRCAFKLSVIW